MGAFGGPPAAPQAVNPLGGTMAADAAGFSPFGAPQAPTPPPQPSPFGAPPPAAGGWPDPSQQQQPPQGFGGPPPGQPGFGPPQAAPPDPNMGFGAPPPAGGFGGPPPGAPYGAPPGQPAGFGQPGAPGGYGAPPPQQGFGQQMGAGMQQMGAAMGAGMQGMGMGGAMSPMAGGAPGGRPTVRNPIMVLLMPGIIVTAGVVVCNILAMIISPFLGMLSIIPAAAGGIMGLMSLIKMTNELKAVTGNQAFAWWPVLIPIYQLLWSFSILPQEVQKAKQMTGTQQPARSGIVYFFLTLYAFAADLNDIAKRP
jgi:hypothetical protein